MKLIVGLGNPGDKYVDTRHNLGFMVVEQLLKDYTSSQKTGWTRNDKMKSEMVQIDWQRQKKLSPQDSGLEKVILAKPLTYMNNSGMAVSLLSLYYKIALEDIWIIHDELDLPMGKMKIRLGGAAAGHHGVESVIAALKTDVFWRFRLGIGEAKNHDEVARHHMRHAEEYVLGVFSHDQAGKAREMIKHASKAVEYALECGMEQAMNKYNGN